MRTQTEASDRLAEAKRQLKLAMADGRPEIIAIARAQFATHRIHSRQEVDRRKVADLVNSSSPMASLMRNGLVPPPMRFGARLVEPIKRNAPCPCESGAKFKFCCGKDS